jgi:hypothetical protein
VRARAALDDAQAAHVKGLAAETAARDGVTLEQGPQRFRSGRGGSNLLPQMEVVLKNPAEPAPPPQALTPSLYGDRLTQQDLDGMAAQSAQYPDAAREYAYAAGRRFEAVTAGGMVVDGADEASDAAARAAAHYRHLPLRLRRLAASSPTLASPSPSPCTWRSPTRATPS